MLDENLKVFERNKERNGVFEFGASSEQRGCYVPDLSNETLEEKSIHENQHGCTQPIIVRRACHQSDSTRSGHKFEPFDHFDNRLRTFREDIEEFLHRQPSLLQHDHINRTSGRSIEMVLRREYETEYGLRVYNQLRRIHHHDRDFEIYPIHWHLSGSSIVRPCIVEEVYDRERDSVDLVLVHHLTRYFPSHIRLFRGRYAGYLHMHHDHVHHHAVDHIPVHRRVDHLRIDDIERNRRIVEDGRVEALYYVG